jgi:hypothetical protein
MKTRSQTKTGEMSLEERIQYEDNLDLKFIKPYKRKHNWSSYLSEWHLDCPISNELDVNIDFDHAAKCWRQNKKAVGNSCYVYVCGSLCKTGKMCEKKCLNGQNYCWLHSKNHQDDSDSEQDFVPRRG